MNRTKSIDGLGAMQKEAVAFIEELKPEKDTATIVALSGDLGAGKTTFAQGIARALGVEETVTSPTFVIEKVYELNNQCWTYLIHIDAYRLKDAHELEVLGWNEMARNPSNLIIIEWPEVVMSLIPKNAIRITFAGCGNTREISTLVENNY